ncbi:phenylalanine--tRNA ligase subunit beta [Candidatus Pacearchaeota archaeon]|nr:phenylalanine--tRNA ligase subunit beta [Candidatus Pacearchaeota archaeon]|tara:strand:- start:1606 stop:3255 length:1650 start_codon:yes stop_codon:yes gene_type:complete
MTILTLNKKELEDKMGVPVEKIEEKITMMGTPVENVTDSEVSVEVFPNRPDLLSLQGFARSLKQYLGRGGAASFKVKKSGEKLLVEKSLPKEWPYAIACIVKGIKFDDEKIKEVIDIQEKLGEGVLRKRKKGGIGLYPLEKIKFPIKFVGMNPDEIKFRPLEFPKVITGRQILRQHPTGRDYASICQDWDAFPVFVDDEKTIMSMPPIINSHEVGKISETTSDVFLEATGPNLQVLQKAFNIMVTALSDMGGQIYSIECKQQNGQVVTVPELEPEKLEFKIENVNRTLGLDLSEKDVRGYLGQMGLGFEKAGGKVYALVPAYRTDILHWVDIAEEVAIAYGYDNFEPEIAEIATIGDEDKSAKVKKAIGNVLTGLGLFEVSSFHLAKKRDVKKMHFDFKDWIEIEDSKTEYGVLRIDLLSNLLKILAENSDAQYPQKIFELGKVFSLGGENETGIDEKEKLAICLADEKISFTDLKSVLDYLFKMIGVDDWKIEEIENSNFIPGRVGKVIVNGSEVGVVGEVAPRVLKNWKIKVPVVAVEIDLDWILLS